MAWRHTAFIGLIFADLASAQILISYFDCKNQGGNSYRPYYMQAINDGTQYRDYSQTAKGLLGQNAMPSIAECTDAVAAANGEFGVICSRTGLGGWKPTIYTGTTPGRADYGYLGGSSIESFADCLKATQNSSVRGVCFWGGSSWYVSPIDREGIIMGPYRSIDECVTHTAPH